MGHTHNEDTRKHMGAIGVSRIIRNIKGNC
jgi:hypothetical protein